MTTAFIDKLPDVTIPNGTAVSNIIPGYIIEDAISIELQGPTTLGTDSGFTFTLEVCPKRDAVASDILSTLQAGDVPADVSAPAVLKARDYPELCRGSFRIKSSSNVTADRTWKASKQWTA